MNWKRIELSLSFLYHWKLFMLNINCSYSFNNWYSYMNECNCFNTDLHVYDSTLWRRWSISFQPWPQLVLKWVGEWNKGAYKWLLCIIVISIISSFQFARTCSDAWWYDSGCSMRRFVFARSTVRRVGSNKKAPFIFWKRTSWQKLRKQFPALIN